MKLTAHVIPAKPSAGDLLAQRGYVALIWEADKELVEIEGEQAPEKIAARVAMVAMAGAFKAIAPFVNGEEAMQLMVEEAARVSARMGRGA